MQATEKEKKVPVFVAWIVRGVAVVMTVISIVFLVLCGSMVTTMDGLSADYSMIDEPRIVYEERQIDELTSAISSFKTKSASLKVMNFIEDNGYDADSDAETLLNQITNKAILDETGLVLANAAAYNALKAEIANGGTLSAAAQSLKDFLDENGLPCPTSIAFFWQAVKEVVFGDKIASAANLTALIAEYNDKAITAEATTSFKAALIDAGFGDTVYSTKYNDLKDMKTELDYTGYSDPEFNKLVQELTRYNAMVEKISVHKSETTALVSKVAAIEEKFGVDLSFNEIVQLADAIETDLLNFELTPQDVDVLDSIIANMTTQKAELAERVATLNAELTKNNESQDATRETHKVYLWVWIIFEILALLTTSALLAMPEVLGGNEKISRISGAVLFLAVAVQLVLILHLGIM